MRGAASLIAAALVWTLAAFAGVYPWTLAPAAALLVGAALRLRPTVFARDTRVLDTAIAASIAWAWLQAVPLPRALRETLSPHLAAIEAVLRFGTGAHAAPLSLDPQATLLAAFTASLAAVAFWSAREACARGGVRHLVRVIAWTQLGVAIAAVLIKTTSPGWLFGMTTVGGGGPFGPFVNRNHMGTWLIMAGPLTIGYLFARVEDRAARATAAAAIDAVMVWLSASVAAMLMAIVMSLSRSTAIGLATAALYATAVASKRGGRARWMVPLALGSAVALVLLQPQTLTLVERFQDSRTTAAWSRPQIWRETLPIVRDFPLTGVGAGAYRAAMLVYQRTDRTLFFNQAHDHYLQIAAEGGLLLLLPLACAAAAWSARARAALTRDRSPMFFIRTGATASVAAVAVQSIWETGLRMPANGLLFGVICAIAVYAERAEGTSEEAGTRR